MCFRRIGLNSDALFQKADSQNIILIIKPAHSAKNVHFRAQRYKFGRGLNPDVTFDLKDLENIGPIVLLLCQNARFFYRKYGDRRNFAPQLAY
jgi:hypothetical protein